MSSIDALKQQALEIFGKRLSDEQLEAYKGRLPTMVQNVQLLERWSTHLDHAQPAQIQRLFDDRASREDRGHD